MKKALVILLFCLPFMANAQLRFTNHVNEPVVVAYAMKSDSKDFQGWFTQGWFHVAPNETVVLSSATGLNQYVYYYAKGTQSGREYSGNTNFLVDETNAFALRNSDMSYVAQQNTSLKWKPFRPEKIGKLELRHTINLMY